MSKIEELKQTYLKDADQMASKSRFGYFSIPPNAAAGLGPAQGKKLRKDQNGKVRTQERGIFSGLTASGVLKKSFFGYVPSVYHGDPYADPGKHERLEKLEESKKLVGKDVYKPLSLIKTPDPKASYEHIPEKPTKKTVKDCVDSSGKVLTENRNILTNSITNIEKQRLKEIKYVPDPYQNFIKVQREEAQRSVKLRGEAPFRAGSPMKAEFCTYRQTYGGDGECKPKKVKVEKFSKTVDHEANFKPSCTKNFDNFSYPQYIPGGTKEQPKPQPTPETQTKQKLKIGSPFQNSKPSPSISTMKSNLLRKLR